MNQQLYRIPDSFADAALIKQSDYRRMYAESVEDPERFWGRIGRRLDWIKDFSRVKDSNYEQSNVHIRWFYDGTRSGKIMRRILRKIAANEHD
jgi:acetyl-CoA synthetase